MHKIKAMKNKKTYIWVSTLPIGYPATKPEKSHNPKTNQAPRFIFITSALWCSSDSAEWIHRWFNLGRDVCRKKINIKENKFSQNNSYAM